MEPSPARVHAASAAWLWVPSEARVLQAEDYLAVRFPLWFEHPLQLLVVRPRERDVETVLDDALERARTELVDGTGLTELVAWVRLDAPGGLEAALVARGAVLDETLDVLARALVDPPDLALPADVDVRWANDIETFVDSVHLNADVFGGTRPERAALERLFAGEQAKLRSGGGGAVVAYVDGAPVGTGGITVAGPDGRLWGGGVLPEARGRGVYRALLAARLAYAVAQGCELAIVKGRVETSGPILRRAGFAPYGQERSYRLSL